MESYVVIKDKLYNLKSFILWHDCLGHPRSLMMHRIIENSHGHLLKDLKNLLSNKNSCTAYSRGKLIVTSSPNKIGFESPLFFQKIQEDIIDLIHPLSSPFHYFIVLIDASTRWSHVCLLSTYNIAFARLLAQIIRLWAQFADYLIKTTHLDNAREFTSKTFDDYWMVVGIDVEHPVPHVHTQNGLA